MATEGSPLRCPRCGQHLPEEGEAWERLEMVGHLPPAYRNRHERPDGKPGDRKCVCYSGGVEQKGEGALAQ